MVVDVRNDLIVPDVVGYFLVFIAARSLGFPVARWCALIAAVASLFALASHSLWPFLVQAFFEIVMIWFLCTGVLHLATADSNASLARSAATARSLTVFAGVLNFAYAALFYGFAIAIPHAGVGLLAFGWSVMVIVSLVMMRAAQELSFPRR